MVRRRLSLDASPFVAFLGALEPRKNVPALIRGFARASRIRAGRSDPPALVLAGQPGWDSQVGRELQGVPHRVRVTGPATSRWRSCPGSSVALPW